MIKFLLVILALDVAFVGMMIAPRLATSGDCDDYALASYGYLETLGFTPEIKHTGTYPLSHIWVEFEVFGVKMAFDNGVLRTARSGSAVSLDYLISQVEKDKR